MLNGTCIARPETTNMRSLLARLTDVARINGYGLASVAAEGAQSETDVEAKPVQALRTQASEVLAVALFAVPTGSKQGFVAKRAMGSFSTGVKRSVTVYILREYT